MHTFNPGVHLTALGLANLHAVFRSQRQQGLQAWLAAPFRQPDLLDPLRMVLQQRLHGMHTVDFFQLTHDLFLLLRGAPDFGGPLRCLVGLPEGLPPLSDLLPALPPVRASVISAFFISRLLRTSALRCTASFGK
ncbi:hypothetical protein D3C81_1794510 [compost metagenome]